MHEEKHGDILKQHHEIWSIVKDLIGKDFDMELVYDEKYITANTKSYRFRLKLISMM